MKKNFYFLVAIFAFCLFNACKKSTTDTPTVADVKTNFVGNWAGAQQVNGAPNNPYKFSLQINADNTVLNVDSSANNQHFPGTCTYTSDSLKIAYNNGTRWKMKFINNYANSIGILLGAQGATCTISMNKK